MKDELILASASPQRKTLLAELGVVFEVVPSTLDEGLVEENDPAVRAQVLARLKANDVAAHHKANWVIGCDTLVVSAEGKLLEKPEHAEEAEEMLRLQEGKTSLVHSGLTLLAPGGKLYEGLSTSTVTFKKLSDDEIAWWIGTNLWQGRSGAFQIDGLGPRIIEKFDGEWSSIVGLPIILLKDLFQRAGRDIESFKAS